MSSKKNYKKKEMKLGNPKHKIGRQLKQTLSQVAGDALMMAATAAISGVTPASLGAMASSGLAYGGSKLIKLMGRGDYTQNMDDVKANSLFKTVPSANASFSRTDSMKMRNREFVKNVISPGTTGFVVDTLSVNPGLSEMFPYLSNVAKNFTKYKVLGMVIEFVSLVSSYTTNAAMGSIMLSADYNQGAPAPTNKVAMENLSGAVSCKPSNSIVFGLECKQSSQPFLEWFVRTGATTYTATSVEDFARVYIALAGLTEDNYPAGSVLGEIWVTYDVELSAPRLPYLLGGYLNDTRELVSGFNPMGATLISSNRQGALFSSYSTNNAIWLVGVPIGSILRIYLRFINGSTATAPTLGTAILEKCSFYNESQGTGANIDSVKFTQSAATSAQIWSFCILTNADDPTVTLHTATWASNGKLDVIVELLGQGISFTGTPDT